MHSGITLKPIMLNGKFFCFIEINGLSLVIDYLRFGKELIDSNDGGIVLGCKQKRILTRINELQRTLVDLIYATLKLNPDSLINLETDKPPTFTFNINNSEIILINQIVFDLLFQKYITDESKQLTLHNYCVDMCNLLESAPVGRIIPENLYNDTALIMQKRMNKAIKLYTYSENNSGLINNIEEADINPATYFEYLQKRTLFHKNKEKKPEYIWDFFYWTNNPNLMFMNRQYTQKLIIDKNYQYSHLLNDINKHDDFIDILMPKDGDTDKEYFQKSMRYYHLEMFNRFDFICKLAKKSPDFDIKDSYVKGFCCNAIYPFVDNGVVSFGSKPNTYRPFMSIGDSFADELRINTLTDLHLFRAIVYELFNYHFEYKPPDQVGYADIANFIRNYYDVVRYRNTEKEWRKFKNIDWYYLDDDTRKNLRICMKTILNINKKMFGKRLG